MNIQELFTKETTIKVSVVTLDGKKMTKSIFNQLHHVKPFDNLYNIIEGVKFLGYINEKERFVIFTLNNKIYYYRLEAFLALQYIDLNKSTIEDLYRVYPSEEVKRLHNFNPKKENDSEDYRQFQISQVFSVNGQYEFIEKAENLKKIRNEILKRQIFL